MSESSPQSGPEATSAGGVFVGRQRELGELRAALEESLAGRGRLAMLVGEPGIGKTRTAQELASYAETRGTQVLWGRCYEEEGAPPYWPWVQPIRSYVQQQDAERLQAEMGAGAADIAEIVPEIRRKLTDLEPPPSLEPEQARFRLFDSITSFLKSAARSQPLMLVLDDLHWADEPSLLLLSFLAQQLSDSCILVVGCYRDVELSRQHPLSATLAQLSREQVFQRHLLRGLSRDETGRLVEETAGIRPNQPLVENVFAHTEGNPYFLTEVVRLLSQQGELGGAESSGLPSLRIPEGVREVIGQRLNRLSSECNRVLATASIIGREFSLDQLARLFDDPSTGVAQRLAENQVLEALEEAREVRLIEELPQTVGRYQFAHRLAQETLIQELSLTQRVRLHARIALTLEELYGARVEEHAAELAYHFTQAETVTGTEKLVRYCLLAGEQALAAYAFEEALPHFERALSAREDQPVDANTAALLFGLARAQIATFERHRQEVAVSNLARALEYYSEVGDADQAVAVAEFPDYGLGLPSVSQLTIRALSLVPPDSHQAGRLLCRYGQYIGLEESDYDAAQSAFGRALAIARREGDLALEMRTLADAAGVYSFHMCWEEVMSSALKAIELARVAEDPRSEVAARYFAITALTAIGDSEEARRHASAMLAPAERLRDHFWLKSALWKNGVIYRLTGEWATSREYNDHSLAISPWYTTLSDRVLLECELGDFTQSKARLDEFLEVVRTSIGRARITSTGYVALVIPLFARITGILDQLDTVKRAGETILSSRFAHPNAVSHARAGLGLVAFLRDDLAAAGEQYAELGSVRGTLLWWVVSGDRLLALLSMTMERLDQAVNHFEDSLEFCRNAGYRPELAWTYCDYAEALCQRNEPGDREKARALLHESRSIATELGMRPLMERAQDRLDRIGSTAFEAPEYPSGLSQREVEVLRLVALGKSNREIGDELVITEGTVRRHVSNVYRKIGANNRSEATSYALREGLVSFE